MTQQLSGSLTLCSGMADCDLAELPCTGSGTSLLEVVTTLVSCRGRHLEVIGVGLASLSHNCLFFYKIFIIDLLFTILNSNLNT